MSNTNDGVPPIPVPPAGNGTPAEGRSDESEQAHGSEQSNPTSPYGPAATVPLGAEPVSAEPVSPEPGTVAPVDAEPASTEPAPPAYTAPAYVPPANPYTSPTNPYTSQQNPYAGNPYATGTATPPQGLSITSMVLGIVSLMASFALLGFLPSLAAVITGHLAQKRQPHARAFWLTGLITGYVGLVVALLTGFLFVIPLLMWMFTSGY